MSATLISEENRPSDKIYYREKETFQMTKGQFIKYQEDLTISNAYLSKENYQG